MNKIKEHIYVFGDTEYTPYLKKRYTIVGIIDEKNPNKTILGIPNIPLCNIDKNAYIINTVNNSRAFQAQKRLIDEGFSNTTFVGSLINKYPSEFKSTTLAQAQIAMKKDYSSLLKELESFADNTSKEAFKNILNFRLTLNIKYLSSFEVKIDEQYFEDFLLDCSFKTLIDGGAYDGADSKRFIKLFPTYEQIFVLEPSDKNGLLVKNNLKAYPNIHIIKACLGEKNGHIRFEGTGTAAKIVQVGGTKVEQRTIDSFNSKHRTLVKLDIEGAEMSALNGATSALLNAEYSFAISAYHLPHDLLDILMKLKSSSQNRKLYFRHYSGGFAESVLFAI